MPRTSYAQRLAGHVPHRLPVLKPPVSPFQLWNALRFSTVPGETSVAASSGQGIVGDVPPAEGRSAVASLTASMGITQEPAFIASADAKKSAPVIHPQGAAIPSEVAAATNQQPESPMRNARPDPLHADRSLSTTPARIERSKTKKTFPTPQPAAGRTSVSYPAQQEGAFKSSDAIPSAAQQPREVLSSSKARNSDATKNGVTATQELRVTPGFPLQEAAAEGRVAQSNSRNVRQELHPRRSLLSDDLSIISAKSTFNRAQSSASAPARVAQEAARGGGGIHIGTIEVQILPSLAPPVVRPVKVSRAPATALSRSFTSWLGLSQG